jgi:integrase
MPSVVQLPSGRFRAFARHKGMKDAQVFDIKTQAERWAEATENRMRGGKWKARVVAAASKGKTVKEGFEAYRESEEWLSKTATTRKVEVNKQTPVIDRLGDMVLAELAKEDVKTYIAKRRKDRPARSKDPNRRMSNDAVRLEVAALSSMCNWAVEEKWIESNPTRDVKRPTPNRREQRMDDDVIGEILSHPAVFDSPKAYLFFCLLFSTVCRPGELANARMDWLRMNPPQIAMPKTKNEDARVIVIPLNLYRDLKSYLEDDHDLKCEYIFGTPKLREDGWSPYNYGYVWQKVSADLKLSERGLVPHIARHEGVSRLFERTDLSDGQIAAISGHRSPQALWRYKHLRAEHSRPIIDQMATEVANALNRAISPSHPSRTMMPGEMFTRDGGPDTPERQAKFEALAEEFGPKPEYVTEEQFRVLEAQWVEERATKAAQTAGPKKQRVRRLSGDKIAKAPRKQAVNKSS